MTDYREVLRLRSLGINHSKIAESMAISRPTVITVLQRAAAQGLDWRGAEGLSDRELALKLFPPGESKAVYTMPDFEWVHREMAKPGVTLQLLWMEYSDKCCDSGLLPYQFTQFRKYYRDYLLKTKATMHINRKPGEVMEVDWAGQTAKLIDTDTGEPLDAYVFVAALPYSGYAYAHTPALEEATESHDERVLLLREKQGAEILLERAVGEVVFPALHVHQAQVVA